jgi:hypothetical protein
VPRTKRWTIQLAENGLRLIHLSSWKYFPDLINQTFLPLENAIWRGHASAKWNLEPTLDRLLRQSGRLSDPTARPDHLARFRLATRGRRGASAAPILNDDDWWALGQHFGLATPLLDWTNSPYVALYFAFNSDTQGKDDSRAIFALHQRNVEGLSEEVRAQHTGIGRPPVIEFIHPQTDENARLVNQSGLFSRGPDGVTIETWLKTHVPVAAHQQYTFLVKIVIPDKGREDCLRALNRMNINHSSLFPDLYGSSKHCNNNLLISSY